MSKREVTVWYVVYGLVVAGAGAIVYDLYTKGRLFDCAVVMLMTAAALWMSMSNHDDPLEPPAPDSY